MARGSSRRRRCRCPLDPHRLARLRAGWRDSSRGGRGSSGRPPGAPTPTSCAAPPASNTARPRAGWRRMGTTSTPLLGDAACTACLPQLKAWATIRSAYRSLHDSCRGARSPYEGGCGGGIVNTPKPYARHLDRTVPEAPSTLQHDTGVEASRFIVTLRRQVRRARPRPSTPVRRWSARVNLPTLIGAPWIRSGVDLQAELTRLACRTPRTVATRPLAGSHGRRSLAGSRPRRW